MQSMRDRKLKFVGLLGSDVGRALMRTYLARFLVAIGAFVLLLVVGRLYGASGLGVFALAQSLMLAIAMVVKYGMNTTLMKVVGGSKDEELSALYLIWTVKMVLLSSCTAALILWYGRHYLEVFFSAAGLGDMLVGISLALPPFTLAFLFSGYLKGIRKPAAACFLENGAISLICGCLIYANSFISADVDDVSNIGFSYAASAWLVFICSAYNVYKRGRAVEKKGSIITHENKKKFLKESRDFFLISVTKIFQTTGVFIAAGIILNNEEVGFFKAAVQVSNLISFVLVVINSVYPPRFSRLYKTKQNHRLAKMARQTSVIGVVSSFPIFILCFIFPEVVLHLMGDSFMEAILYVQLLSVVQMFNVFTGSVVPLLNMTGNAKIVRNIAMMVSVTAIALLFLLAPLLGVLGATISFGYSILIQNLLAWIFVEKKLKIRMIPKL